METMYKYANQIQERLEELAIQTRIDGEIWRAIYTEEDKKAKQLIKNYMIEAGLEVREDAIGNVYGRLQGASERVILTGSHIDTVRDGGKYDGALGVVMGISVLKHLVKKGIKPAKTVEVVAFAEEEGSRYDQAYIGSRAIIARLTPEDLMEKDARGISLREAMESAGYSPEKIHLAKRDDIDMFVELHIEQGPVLEQEKKQIGIVNNIVGFRVYKIKIHGEQNHAGTTPMKLRKDPMKAAVHFISEIDQATQNLSETATITFGRINAFPGMSNVVPKTVELLMDFRDSDDNILDKVEEKAAELVNALEEMGYHITIDRIFCEAAVALHPLGINAIRTAVKEKEFSFMELNSGAGHDAQGLAECIPACMIFIPSKNGVSHNPQEFSSLSDIEAGAAVLEKTLELLAW